MAYVSWFTIQHEVAYGSGLWVVGSCRCMGSWNVYEAHPLQWRPGHVWSCRVRHQDECVFDGGFEYKYIEWHRHQDDAPQWESRQNRRLELPAEDEAHTGTRVVKTNDRWDSDFTIREFTLFPPSTKVAVVVLGKRLLPSGNATATLEVRMQRAIVVFHELKAEVLVVSGGRVETGGAEYSHATPFPSEAEVMRRLAEAGGVPAGAIVKEELAMNTIENALNVRDLAEELGLGVLHIVTSEYHVERSRSVFAAVFRSRPNVALEFHGHESPISEVERQKEEQVERFMLEKLPVHLRQYTNNR